MTSAADDDLAFAERPVQALPLRKGHLPAVHVHVRGHRCVRTTEQVTVAPSMCVQAGAAPAWTDVDRSQKQQGAVATRAVPERSVGGSSAQWKLTLSINVRVILTLRI